MLVLHILHLWSLW